MDDLDAVAEIGGSLFGREGREGREGSEREQGGVGRGGRVREGFKERMVVRFNVLFVWGDELSRERRTAGRRPSAMALGRATPLSPPEIHSLFAKRVRSASAWRLRCGGGNWDDKWAN